MKNALLRIPRAARAFLALLGLLALLAGSLQLTRFPWQAYKRLGTFPNPSPLPPTHVLVMGGSGIPGESGLMRTFYGARAAALHPNAELLVAMPLGADESEASRAYLDELALRGVPPARMRILPHGRNTREQALRLAETLGAATNAACVLVVTDPTHVRRTALSLRRAGIAHVAALPAHQFSIEDSIPWNSAEQPSEPRPAPAETITPAADSPNVGPLLLLRYNLWTNVGYTQKSLREYAGLFAYWWRGWI